MSSVDWYSKRKSAEAVLKGLKERLAKFDADAASAEMLEKSLVDKVCVMNPIGVHPQFNATFVCVGE